MRPSAIVATDVTEISVYDGDAAAWDGAITSFAGATHSHLAGWHRVMRALGHDVIPLRAVDPSGTWRGVLPLVHVRSRLFGSHLMSMPFLNAGGPLGDAPTRRALVQRAIEEAGRRGCRLLELRSRDSRDGATRPSDRKITVELALPRDPAVLLRGFHQKVRANIKKPTREGMEMRFGAVEVDAFWEVLAHNMRDLGTPVLPRDFFRSIAETFPDSAHFGALHHRGRPVGAQCSFIFGQTLEMVWGSTLRELNALKPSSLIHWAYMELAIARGCTTFDFGRCTLGSGTHLYKKQWGGTDVPLPWSTWSPGDATTPPTPHGTGMRLAVAVWRRLPLAVTNRLGPRLARFLP